MQKREGHRIHREYAKLLGFICYCQHKSGSDGCDLVISQQRTLICRDLSVKFTIMPRPWRGIRNVRAAANLRCGSHAGYFSMLRNV